MRGSNLRDNNQAVCEVRADAPPREDASGAFRTFCSREGGTGWGQSRYFRLPRLHAPVRPKSARKIHAPCQDDEEAAPAQPHGCCRLVSTTSARPCAGAATDPQREAARPLPVLRPTHELPQSAEVLSEGSVSLEDVAHATHEGPKAHLGALRPVPATLSARGSPNHPLLGWCGESHLRNPLRQFRTVGSVRGEVRWHCASGLLYSEANLRRSPCTRSAPSSERSRLVTGPQMP